MSLLADHFARRALLEATGIPLTHGVFIDVGNTLDNPDGLVWEFARWNHAQKILTPQIAFSAARDSSIETLALMKRDLREISDEPMGYKQATFNTAYSDQHEYNMPLFKTLPEEARKGFAPVASHMLELLIDDSAPYIPGVMGASLVLTHWKPADPQVQNFLRAHRYKGFRP